METKNLPGGSQVSKAQLEVWEWKEKAYEEIKNLPKTEQLKYILSQTKETVEMLKEKKKRLAKK